MQTKSLHFKNTITVWDEALPLGNGDSGCLIWNSSDKLRFTLDKGGIWDCSNPPENQKNFTYADMTDAVKQGKNSKLWRKYDDCYNAWCRICFRKWFNKSYHRRYKQTFFGKRRNNYFSVSGNIRYKKQEKISGLYFLNRSEISLLNFWKS